MTTLLLVPCVEPHLKCLFIVSFGMTHVPLSVRKLFLFQVGGVNKCGFLNAQNIDLSSSNVYSKKNGCSSFFIAIFL